MLKVVRFAVFAALSVFLVGSVRGSSVTKRQSAPTVQLDNGTFTGTSTGTLNKFLGIPYAKPPVGDLRYRLPQTIPAYSGVYSATAFGASCPQQAINILTPDNLPANVTDFLLSEFLHDVLGDSEDCLTLNVIAPANATSASKLPVAVWIYGGGFEFGSTNTYDGSSVVDRSITLGEPIVYVSMNYRVSGWGFLGSKEVKEAGVGNLGLQDQRESFRWIQKYIESFGGDPTKVTIWGESAGAISVGLHMVTNGGDTEGLFRGGFMESGSPLPSGDITDGQPYYDAIVNETGCSGALDTLQCLREVDSDTLRNAINKSPSIFSYQSVVLAFGPRADGVFLKAPPQQLVLQGSVADIPFVNGDCDDEGTLFSFPTYNITTTDQLHEYLKTYLYPDVADSDIDGLLQVYPEDVTQGSPFDTGILNAVTPQNKRISALFGDILFQGPRRFFLQQRSGKQNMWSFVSKRLKALPILGSSHATDILNVYGSGDLTDFLVNFANNLDPNGAGGHIEWPKYTVDSPNMMTLLDGLTPEIITQDTYRTAAIAYLNPLSLKSPPL